MNDSPAVIRAVTPADARTIARFNALLALETEARTLDEVRLSHGVAAVLADASKGTYWVAEADAVVIGQLLITREWSDWRNGFFWWIQSVYVDQAWRGRGIFTSLFQFVRQRAAKEPDVCGLRLYVEAQNIRARQTYERLGWQRTHYEIYEVDFRQTP